MARKSGTKSNKEQKPQVVEPASSYLKENPTPGSSGCFTPLPPYVVEEASFGSMNQFRERACGIDLQLGQAFLRRMLIALSHTAETRK